MIPIGEDLGQFLEIIHPVGSTPRAESCSHYSRQLLILRLQRRNSIAGNWNSYPGLPVHLLPLVPCRPQKYPLPRPFPAHDPIHLPGQSMFRNAFPLIHC